MVTDTPVRVELLEASDQQIEESLEYPEPLVLRGLLYQLTGDEDLVRLNRAALVFLGLATTRRRQRKK